MKTKLIANNREAHHNFFIEESYEAGIELVGCEVKSIRLGKVNLRDSYAILKDNEVFLLGAHISPYEKGSYYNVDTKRTRKLLLHRHEINKIRGKVQIKGYTLVVTKMYLKQGLVKVELAIASGKEGRDKRNDIKERDTKRMTQRIIKESNYR
ncbi:MAG: SsrA-binding protein SmpB [Bacillota bacterium]